MDVDFVELDYFAGQINGTKIEQNRTQLDTNHTNERTNQPTNQQPRTIRVPFPSQN